MLKDSKAYSGFSVSDIDQAKSYYRDVLGLEVQDDEMGLQLNLGGDLRIFVYQKDDHQPATYTVLNFPVEDIESVIDGLVAKGVQFERYDNLPAPQDERGILRGKAAGYGPDIAWFEDPSGNVFSVLCD